MSSVKRTCIYKQNKTIILYNNYVPIHIMLPLECLQSVPITTKVVSSNPVHGEVYSIHYVIKFVSDLPQVGDFLRVLRFPPTIKLTAKI